MHGRVKVRTTAEQEIIKKIERTKKAAEFKKSIELIFQKRKNQEWDNELLLITEKLLVRFPDVYTLWNIRREAFLNNNWSDEERTEKLEKELSLTEASLRENPKSYCVWHQRTWVIEQLKNPNWKRELDLCNKCLNLDERNFHCWDYRHFVVNKANIPDKEELDFTTTKILNNFSNYSSWHYRSKLLRKLYPSSVHDLPIRADKHDEELDLVMNATFTDPNDSSAWFYHRWLLDYWQLPFKLWEAVISHQNIKVAFHTEVPLNLELFVNDRKIETNWIAANGKKCSAVWYAEFEKPIFNNYEEVSLKFENKIHKFKPTDSECDWIYKNEVPNRNSNSEKLREQLKNYQELSKMEPSNKWAKLTSAYLMLNINPIDMNSSIIEELNELMKIDPLRINYYKDMRSKYIIYNTLNDTAIKNESNRARINLENKELTSLCGQEPYFTFFDEITLRNNNLGNRLYQLHTLQSCVILDLSNNNIVSLKAFPTLCSLKILLLSFNQITNNEEVIDLIKRLTKLIKLDLRGNPVVENDVVNDVRRQCPMISVANL